MNENGIVIKINDNVLELVKGDITAQKTDSIVNAANSRLAPGGGVAGAIHRAAGYELWKECKKLDGCRTGEAKITKGYNLPAPYVIHTVGPVYSSSDDDPILLKASYENSLKLAKEKDLKSISFPALSTGAFGYPKREAAEIAFNTIMNFLRNNKKPNIVRFVLYSERDFNIHKEVLENLLS
ncbi:MAG: O-acetyl-ADP-ribose deacetylase [Actinobacteria bacterium]|nr:O-acetyl-ADP-ribose deacetylase [Actinomycetota bacterium]